MAQQKAKAVVTEVEKDFENRHAQSLLRKQADTVSERFPEHEHIGSIVVHLYAKNNLIMAGGIETAVVTQSVNMCGAYAIYSAILEQIRDGVMGQIPGGSIKTTGGAEKEV